MKKVRIGVLGGYRGTSMINYCRAADNAEVVAICDNAPHVLEMQKQLTKGMDIAFYDNFEDFLNHDMDAVVLANFATEHAPYAIRAMKAGKHVFSEVLPVQTMKEAVELVETVEQTGMIYAYGENYCFMPAPFEMKKLYRQGKIGEFEYGECEYIGSYEPVWHSITYGDKNHWRNNMYSTFYCTHSIGPIIHATGLKPVSVIGFEGGRNERPLRNGCKGAQFGITMITLENGAIIKSINGCFLYEHSVWYSMYGGKGLMESERSVTVEGDQAAVGQDGIVRTIVGGDGTQRIYVKADEYSGEYAGRPAEHYMPLRGLEHMSDDFNHGGSDFYSMYYFVERIKGDKNADIIDVYEALDMFLPGMFAYRSILADGKRMAIPDLRDKSIREKWRNDTACVDPKVAGDMLLPTQKGGTPQIDDAVYARVKAKWDRANKTGDDAYLKAAFSQGSKKEN